jgi:predicted site-specific integrase-resolvase
VSLADQKAGLDRQVARVTAWAAAEQIRVDRVVGEVGSALNGHRRKFLTLPRDPTVNRIVVEHRNRFCRFGSEYIEPLLPPRAVSWWWSIRQRSMTTWYGIWPRC